MAQHEQGVSALPFSQQAEHKWQSNLQANHINPDVSRPLPSQHASQGMNAFQPIMDMGLQSTSSQKALSASTRLQPARQPAAMAADRYQHATDLASPGDDFVWQPIRPQTSQRSEQYTAMHDTAAGSHAVSAADTPDSQDPMWMTHVGPLSGTGRHSRSLRESLDAAARLDSRLQLAQQEQQQQQQSHWPMQEPQWHLRQGQQNEPAATFAQASSSSWQTMQDPYAVVQPAASEHAANMRHRQQPLSDASAPPLHDAIPLTDRFGPQQGADFLPGRQGQYHMAPIGSSSADWSTHAEPDAVQQARLHGSRLSGMQGVAQHNSWVAEASQEESSTEQAAHESQHATSSGNAAAGNGCRAEATAQVPAAGSDPQHPYQVGKPSVHACYELLLDLQRSGRQSHVVVWIIQLSS